MHGKRGRRPVNAADLGVTRRVVELATGACVGFNQQHLTETLAEREGMFLRHSTKLH